MGKSVRWFLLAFLSLWVLLSGCSSSTSPIIVAETQAQIIMECILSNDAEGLKQVMSPELLAVPDLDAQITAFLKFFDGNIVSFSEPVGRRAEGKTSNGKVEEQKLYGRLDDIETDTGKRYLVEFRSVHTDVENPDNIGVYIISAVDLDSYDEDEGYLASAVIRISGSR